MHCRTEQEAEAVKAALQARLAECQLEMHPTKTKIGYCKDSKRRGTYPNVSFDFLGYCFRPRVVKNPQNGRLFCGFTPGVAPSALNHMRTTIRDLKLRQKTHVSLADIAREINPLLRGWIAYYGRFTPSALDALRRHVNQTLCVWVRRKFKRYARPTQAGKFLQRLAQSRTKLFVHWQLGITGKFV